MQSWRSTRIFRVRHVVYMKGIVYFCGRNTASGMTIQFGDITIDIQRKAVRYMRLTVHPDGRVRLSVPLTCSGQEVERFLQSKAAWLRTTVQRFREHPPKAERTYTTGDTIYLHGKPYRLTLEAISFGNAVFLQEDTILLRCKPQLSIAQRKTIIDHFLRRQLENVLDTMVQRWQTLLCEPNVNWTIREMRTEWGSCTPRRRTLRFNLHLAHMPLECVEYVVVHELTHLQAANHGPAFKALMTVRLPDWQERKRRLNALAQTML